MAGPIQRATMASPKGRVVHLVGHLSHDGWTPHVLCTEPVDRQRDPIPGAPLCENCELTFRQIAAAVAELTA
jgi:hypothetical protein